MLTCSSTGGVIFKVSPQNDEKLPFASKHLDVTRLQLAYLCFVKLAVQLDVWSVLHAFWHCVLFKQVCELQE